MFAAGWSDRRQEIVAFTVSSIEDASGAPFTLAENSNGYQSPGVTSAENFQGFGGPFSVTPETIDHVAETILELQRQQRPEHGGAYSIGGLVELVEVTREGVSAKILKRWPDQIGELIQPSPMDWAAWRARKKQKHTTSALAASGVQTGSVIKLSRHERRAAEANARSKA
ncbi:hypothetical protein [Bradyrhizobium sp. MOS002]|uniref:hypothetical protein n=1 Tax=Bradyrhizobium sp. MOS002 TaxID=2133947 RepID=UPI000D123442|nr:hypothetical protein [Bradyrhizobium sp. MOS002]PSO30207.1 hypothetical protein C7G41_19390 [Bradyrhizobium sp. MOS002]